VSGEARRSFACFGGTVTVNVSGAGAEAAAKTAEVRLLDAHRRLSRFLPESDLSRLNDDPRSAVKVSRTLLELAAAVRRAGLLSGGLVDGTLLDEIERAGYGESRAGGEFRVEVLPGSGERQPRPAAPSPARGWSLISVDRRDSTIRRPPGLRIDSGGIAKGLLADLVAMSLREHPSYAVDCCGDIRIGGGRPRTVLVEGPAGGEPLHSMAVRSGGVATSGIGKRSWVGADGTPAHHLLDPSTGAPAFTGIVQATAQAPTAFLAEVYSKLALLSGPEQAPERLPYGGVLVLDDGSVEVVEAQQVRPRPTVAQ
jgi:thiamine biosynthesis lipoprotein